MSTCIRLIYVNIQHYSLETVVWYVLKVSNNKLCSFSSVNYFPHQLLANLKIPTFFSPLHLKVVEFRWKILSSGLWLLTIHMSDRDSFCIHVHVLCTERLLWYSTDSQRNRAFSRFRNSEWWYNILCEIFTERVKRQRKYESNIPVHFKNQDL